MRTLYSPLLGIEIVGTTAEVFRLPERNAEISDVDNATRSIIGQTYCLATQVSYRRGIINLNHRTSFVYPLQFQLMQYRWKLAERRIF